MVGKGDFKTAMDALGPFGVRNLRPNSSISQDWASEGSTYDQYAPAYRTGYEGVTKYAGKPYEQIETDLALDYQKHDPNTA